MTEKRSLQTTCGYVGARATAEGDEEEVKGVGEGAGGGEWGELVWGWDHGWMDGAG